MAFRSIPILAVAVVAISGCTSNRRGGGLIPEDVRRLIPAGTTSLVGVKFAELVKSELFENTVGSQVDKALADFASRTGVNPRTDIDEFVVALVGGEPVVIARGRFDQKAIEAKLASEGLASADGVWAKDGAPGIAIRSGTAVVGPVGGVRSALSGGGVPTALEPLFADIDRSAQLWVASTGDFAQLRAPERSNLQNLEKMAGGLQSITAWGELRSGVRLRLVGDCGAEDDAKRLHGAARALIGIARLSTREDKADLLKVYDSLDVRQEGKRVRASVDLTADQFKAVRALFR